MFIISGENFAEISEERFKAILLKCWENLKNMRNSCPDSENLKKNIYTYI